MTEPGLPVGTVDTLFQYADSKEATEAVNLLMILQVSCFCFYKNNMLISRLYIKTNFLLY